MSISVDTLSIKRGVIDTVNFELALKPALVEGILFDQKNNKALQGTIKIEDMNTSVELLTIDTDFEGKFSVELKTGIDYRFIPKVKNYISDAFEIKRNALQNGYTFNPNIPLISISDAIDEGKTFSLKNLLFESNQSVLKTESTLFLDKLYSFLIEYPNLNIEVHAHTDNKGGDASNLLLSQNRAKSVIIYLEQKGITNTRMIAKGFGESKPIANNDTAEGRELNRRVEFKLVK
jgi:outer membrane protein OmpA-like peptidoglycan-associated protein